MSGAGDAVRLACLDDRASTARPMAAAVPVSVALLAALLWPALDHRALLLWAAVVTAAAGLDALTTWRWARVRARGGATCGAEVAMLVSTVLMSGTWASVAWMARPGVVDRELGVVVLCFLVGSVANSQLVNAASTRFCLAFLLPAFAFAFAAYVGGDRTSRLIAAGAALMLVLSVGLHLTANRNWVARHRLADDNARLADELRDANFHLAAANRSLEHRATHDHLTGLANRGRFVEELSSALGEEPDRVAVLFIDVDRFKVLNDSLGHAAGDALLRQLADRARSALGPDDLLARHGGDELTAMLRGVGSAAEALARAERVRASVRHDYEVEGRHVRATISVGLAVAEADDRAEDLLRHADAALYQAKRAGRDCVELFDRRRGATLRQQVDDEVDLREGLTRGEVVAWFQPEVDLRSGELVGAEALARWAHPRRGLLVAGTFVGLAEDAGLAVGLTDAALVETAALLAHLGADRPGLTLRVNLAGAQFADPGLADRIGALLDEAGRPPARLAVDVTESALAAAGPTGTATLRRLRDLGVGVALDEFGFGRSSLALLAELPVDTLKVHRRLVEPLATSPAHRAVVEGVVALGDRLGLDVVAEGVETAAQEQVLVELGCHRAQGFRLGPAMAADRFVEVARTWRRGGAPAPVATC